MRSVQGLRIGSAERTAQVVARLLLAALLAAGLLTPWGAAGADHLLWAAALGALAGLVAITIAAGRVAVVAVPVAVGPAAGAARRRAERSGASRQVHPDAAGHVRSRAPGHGRRVRPA